MWLIIAMHGLVIVIMCFAIVAHDSKIHRLEKRCKKLERKRVQIVGPEPGGYNCRHTMPVNPFPVAPVPDEEACRKIMNETLSKAVCDEHLKMHHGGIVPKPYDNPMKISQDEDEIFNRP